MDLISCISPPGWQAGSNLVEKGMAEQSDATENRSCLLTCPILNQSIHPHKS
jgi:hypothetical protein